MKNLILTLALTFAGTAGADGISVYCQSKTFDGDFVSVGFCVPNADGLISTIVPCVDQKDALVTLAYISGASYAELDPVIFQLSASSFNLSLDEEMLSLTQVENDPIGKFDLTYANMREFKEYDGLHYNLVSQEYQSTMNGSFEHVSCSYTPYK